MPENRASFGVRMRKDGYYAECQIPHGTPHARKGPFATYEQAAAEATAMQSALISDMESQGWKLEVTAPPRN